MANAEKVMKASLRERAKKPRAYPVPAELAPMYGPELAAEYCVEIAELDSQLDSVWPGWREKAPFSHLPLEPLKRTQWLLKRRQHIIEGHAHLGIQFVPIERMRTTDGQPWPRCFSVRPARVEPRPDREPSTTHYGPKPSAPHLAASTGLPLERVEAALAVWDPAAVRNAREHVLRWNKTNPPAKRKGKGRSK